MTYVANNIKKITMNTSTINDSLSIYRSAIAVELSSRRTDVLQLFTMLYPSWLYVQSLSHLTVSELLEHPQISNHNWNRKLSLIASMPIQIDLLIFCEPISCSHLPINCHSLTHLQQIYEKHPKIFKQMQSMCFYHELDKKYIERTIDKTKYKFITSLQFLIESPFTNIVNFYDYILRTDMDAFITPLMLLYIPKTKAIFSCRYMGSPFTANRLEMISKTLNLKHAHLHQMQSTWYVKSLSFVQLATLVVNSTLYLYENEFTKAVCQNIINSKFKDPYNNTLSGFIEKCGWPHWHKGVASLYGQNIAINHIFYNDFIQYKKLYNISVDEWKSKALDVLVDYNWGYRISDTLQIHIINQKRSLTENINRIKSVENIRTFCADNDNMELIEYNDIGTAIKAGEYVSRIIAHSLRDACSILMIDFHKSKGKLNVSIVPGIDLENIDLV
eukprot:95813_1